MQAEVAEVRRPTWVRQMRENSIATIAHAVVTWVGSLTANSPLVRKARQAFSRMVSLANVWPAQHVGIRV